MLIEKIDLDLKSAMKNKQEAIVSTLRMLKAAIKNKEIERKVKSLAEDDFFDVIQKQVKQRKDSIAEFEKANRHDLASKEKNEISILEQYLPQQLTEVELKDLVQKAIQKTGAQSKTDIGKIMKEVMPQVIGKADGRAVNHAALSLLS